MARFASQRTVSSTNCGTEAVGRLPGAEVEGQTQGVPLSAEGQVHRYQLGREPAPAGKSGGRVRRQGMCWHNAGRPGAGPTVQQLAAELAAGRQAAGRQAAGGNPALLPADLRRKAARPAERR